MAIVLASGAYILLWAYAHEQIHSVKGLSFTYNNILMPGLLDFFVMLKMYAQSSANFKGKSNKIVFISNLGFETLYVWE